MPRPICVSGERPASLRGWSVVLPQAEPGPARRRGRRRGCGRLCQCFLLGGSQCKSWELLEVGQESHGRYEDLVVSRHQPRPSCLGSALPDGPGKFTSSFKADPTPGSSLSLEPLCQHRRSCASSLSSRSARRTGDQPGSGAGRRAAPPAAHLCRTFLPREGSSPKG